MDKYPHFLRHAFADEYAAMLEAFEWSVEALGILPDERARLFAIADSIAHGPSSSTVLRERTMRHVIAIADDIRALLGCEDEIREWIRRPNSGLSSGSLVSVMMTPMSVMLDHPDGVRAIHVQLSAERDQMMFRGQLS
ncbi:hypothetical protein [Polymorphobacter megasporae]|uniref:hypothetical protein n=1 Tax=Glacieibacterium megasporae TaxID=2835787 RepID=UPI001C1E75BC|nr:hypothetical protein [Polymorphobacter megasporae]UAJ10633.1 hypothetical protein KTC28_02435 [Polymorphobacter megasporae]